MDLKQLEYFVRVAELGSFTRAAIELDAARMELQLAIQQAPHSPALQRLLDRTELQQTQLRQLANQAG